MIFVITATMPQGSNPMSWEANYIMSGIEKKALAICDEYAIEAWEHTLVRRSDGIV